jgi:hypothetical protein
MRRVIDPAVGDEHAQCLTHRKRAHPEPHRRIGNRYRLTRTEAARQKLASKLAKRYLREGRRPERQILDNSLDGQIVNDL